MSPLFSKHPSIVFLDAATVDYHDVDLGRLVNIGLFRAFGHTKPTQIFSRARDAEIIITNKVALKKGLLTRLKHLKLVCVAATGYNNIDLKACQKQGVAVCNVKQYATASVVEHTFLFLLALSHRFSEHDLAVKSGLWQFSQTFTLNRFPFQGLSGKTLGIVGYGDIGQKVAYLAKGLGMTVLVAELPGRSYAKNPKRQPLKHVLEKSDFLSLHCSLSATTHHLINAKNLPLLKPSACLLNLARGAIVNEGAVARALKNNKLAFYATDVLEHEPMRPRHPFLAKSLKHKVCVTPHVAWASHKTRQRLIDEMAKNILAFLKGKTRNRIGGTFE